MSLSQILESIQHSYPASLINHIYWNTKYSFIREQSHRNHFTAIKRLLNTKSMPEIEDMYDRHPLIKSITSITVITRRVVSIDFYRLYRNDQVIDIGSYPFIERFSNIDFYRLPMPGLIQALSKQGRKPCLGRLEKANKPRAKPSLCLLTVFAC